MFEQGVGGKFSAMRVKRRVAIVIAADTSVGRAVAATLARSGVAVVANYARHRAAAHQLVLDIHAQGGAALAVQASMTVKSQVKALFDATSEFFGRVDIVVLITDASRRSEPGTQDIVWRTDELHVLAEAAHRLPHSGRVVRIRVCPQLSTPDCLHDTWEVASGLAREFHPRSITINLTSTEANRDALIPSTVSDQEVVTPLRPRRPGLTRMGANAVEELVAFLISD